MRKLARHAETRSVSERLQTKQFQRHPSLTRRVTKGFEMRSSRHQSSTLPNSFLATCRRPVLSMLLLLTRVGLIAEPGWHFDVQVEIRKSTGKPVAANLDLASAKKPHVRLGSLCGEHSLLPLASGKVGLSGSERTMRFTKFCDSQYALKDPNRPLRARPPHGSYCRWGPRILASASGGRF
jgi:hypothetical protein